MKFNSAVPKLFRSAQAEQPRIPASRLHGAQRPREGWDSGWDAVAVQQHACGNMWQICGNIHLRGFQEYISCFQIWI